MIKKIIACLTICFIITGIISPVFSDASALPQPNWSDPGISEIINISDLTGWMLNGGTFDVSTYTDAESFMNDYYNSRTKTRLVSPSEDPQDDYYEVLPGFGINNQYVAGDSFARPLDTNRVIASSFRDHSGYGRRLSNEVNDALLSTGNLYDTKIPLLNEIEFANFVGYNHDALILYSSIFEDTAPDVPTPNPDSNYIEYVNRLNSRVLGNGRYFWFYDIPQTVGDYYIPSYPITDYTWVAWASNGSQSSFSNSSVNYTTPWLQRCNILTINVILDNGIYSYSITVDRINNHFLELKNNHDVYFSSGWFNYSNNAYSINGGSNSTTSKVFSFSSANLSDVLENICGNFKNINLYVDGELWALASDTIVPPHITPEFPDAVGGDELPYTTWPISRPRAPYYTNVPGVLQAIDDAIQGDGELDIDDLKPYLTDENGDPVPDPIFDPEPVPIPVPDPVNPDIVPGLPVLPAIPPDMPGFNGVSVLAEIINFTNQSLPTSLIVTFWGIVFGIVILGLIKILHK